MDDKKPGTRKIFLVHGVGAFREAQIVAAVRAGFGKVGFDEIVPFNWDREVGRVFAASPLSLDVGVLSEVSRGLLNAANFGFLDERPYVGLRTWVLTLQNGMALVAQCFGWALLPLFLPHRLLPHAVWLGLDACLGLFVVFAAVQMLGALAAFRWPSFIACTRRLVLTGMWPFVHFMAAPLGFGLVMLAFVPLLALSGFFRWAWESGGVLHSWAQPVDMLAFLLSLYSLSVIVYGIGVLIYHLVTPPLKVLADVFRYIGVSAYASRLGDGFASEFARVAEGCDQMVLLTHSLGSVIAVDVLRERPHLAKELKRLDLVTMGSPLKRLFATIFPGIFSPPAVLCEHLRQNIQSFSWLNIYRRLDYIGGRLTEQGLSGIQERAMPFSFKSHTGYWSDEGVVQTVTAALDARNGFSTPKDGPTIQSLDLRTPVVEATATDYGGRMRWIWERRAWPLKGVLAVLLLDLYLRLVIPLVKWLLPSTQAGLTSVWAGDAPWYLSVWMATMLCVSFYAFTKGARILWRFVFTPYCNTLFGLLSVHTRAWGRNAEAQPTEKKSIWQWPRVVIPMALLLLAIDGVAAVIFSAPWVRVMPRTQLSWEVQSIAFKDSTHLMLAGKDGLQEFSLNGAQAAYPLAISRKSGAATVMRLSPNGENLAWIEATNPACVVAVRIATKDTITEGELYFNECPQVEGKSLVDVATSDAGEVALVYAGSSGAATMQIWRDHDRLAEFTAAGWIPPSAVHFDATSHFLTWVIGNNINVYAAPNWQPSANMHKNARQVAAFNVLAPDLYVWEDNANADRSVTVERRNGPEMGRQVIDERDFGRPTDIAITADGTRIALLYDGALRVWEWRRRDYVASAKIALSKIFFVEGWSAMRNYLYGEGQR